MRDFLDDSTEYISLETAKLAKEKGYDQHPYRNSSRKSMAYYPQFTDGSGKTHLDHPLHNLEYVIAMAPSQAVLQRWLREKHNIHIVSKPFHDSLKNKTTIVADVIRIACGNVTKSPQMDTYEEALEYALIEGLKLIPEKDG